MRVLAAILAVFVSLSAPAMAHAAGTCPPTGLGVSRIVEIDTSGGPLFGDITKSAKEHSFLRPKEVVLTFDDGPLPGVTKSILDTLDLRQTLAKEEYVERVELLQGRLNKLCRKLQKKQRSAIFLFEGPDAAGKAYWTPRVTQRGPRALAQALVRTEPARRLALNDRYQQLLGRSPDSQGAAYWMEQLLKTDGERLMVRSLMQTESFRKAASS